MKIYTKTGDEGKSSLFGGDRISKDDLRLESYGTIDELNSFLGLLISELDESYLMTATLTKIQHLLFNIGSLLATADENLLKSLSGLDASDIQQLEDGIDQMETDLKPLTQFILPGGSQASAYAHICRTICRRAERRIVGLELTNDAFANVVPYINRLSDYLFVLARHINADLGHQDVTWQS